MGFRHVESGPLVRSSYHAHEQAAVDGADGVNLNANLDVRRGGHFLVLLV